MIVHHRRRSWNEFLIRRETYRTVELKRLRKCAKSGCQRLHDFLLDYLMFLFEILTPFIMFVSGSSLLKKWAIKTTAVDNNSSLICLHSCHFRQVVDSYLKCLTPLFLFQVLIYEVIGKGKRKGESNALSCFQVERFGCTVKYQN